MALIDWIKSHKTTLFVILVFMLAYHLAVTFFNFRASNVLNISKGYGGSEAKPASSSLSSFIGSPVLNPAAEMDSVAMPGAATKDLSVEASRMVVQNSTLSLLVSDVRGSSDEIVAYAQKQGGFMVSSSYSRPNESPFATVTVRVPTQKLEESVNYLRGLALKVTSESLMGKDVTDSYVDIKERLATLNKTKEKFEAILDSATKVEDILTVQRELINIQSQIDSLNGRQQAIEQNVAFTAITVYLSTDELSLPYAPDQAFRPAVIFKLAVRSLVNTLRVIGQGVIWIIVYAVVWVPALLIYLVIRKLRMRKK